MTSAFKGRLINGLEFSIPVRCHPNLAKIARKIKWVLAYLVGVDPTDQNVLTCCCSYVGVVI